MLARHHEEELIEMLRPVMTAAGFQRREATWYRFSAETVQVFDLQAAASPSSQRVYFNLGVVPRQLHPPTHFRVFDCPVYGRLDHIIPDRESFLRAVDFADTTLSHDQRLDRIVHFVSVFALPLLDSWQNTADVTAFAASEKSTGFTMREFT